MDRLKRDFVKKIADFLFEAHMLTVLPRSGYAFLGSGRESVAEHVYMTTLICFVISRMEPEVDREKLITLALIHDLAEARTGDLNYVQKRYVQAMEGDAVTDMTAELFFGEEVRALVDEFNAFETREAMLARDADQLSFILALKKEKDLGNQGPEKWLPHILDRLRTKTGKALAESILASHWDAWWLRDYSEPPLERP